MLTTYFDKLNKKEILEQNQYEQFIRVEDKDLVLDLGCSKGYFFYKHKDKLISYIGVDGSIDCLTDFINALEDNESPLLLNYLIGWHKEMQEFQSMYHQNTLKQNVITIPIFELFQLIDKTIDFLKFDIESWEICFWGNEFNYQMFKSFVRKFSGEFHFLHKENHRLLMVECLTKLINDPDFEIRLFSLDNVDITKQFWIHPDYYTEIILSGKNKLFEYE